MYLCKNTPTLVGKTPQGMFTGSWRDRTNLYENLELKSGILSGHSMGAVKTKIAEKFALTQLILGLLYALGGGRSVLSNEVCHPMKVKCQSTLIPLVPALNKVRHLMDSQLD
jgi:hypothetical protein